MVEPAEARIGTFAEPPCPLTPELHSDIAYRRAQGGSWLAVGTALRYDPDALRRATEDDPDFAAAQEKAWAEAAWEGQADGLRRLRQLANGEDDGRALRAAELLLKYAAERRRDDTRLAVERLRAETQQAKTAARVKAEEAPPAATRFWRPGQAPPTEADRQAESHESGLESATRPPSEVYLWGGKHPTGRFVPPDDTDIRVRLVPDWSCGVGMRGTIYWVVPEGAREQVSGTGILYPEDNADLTPAGRPAAA